MRSFSSPPAWLFLAASAVAAAAALASCTYDFDAPFAGTPAGTATTTGATGGGAGTGGGTGLSGGGGSGQGGQAGGENCNNGEDDDGDELQDCADADCTAAWECVLSPGSEWQGPVGLYLGDAAQPPPACPAPWTEQQDYHLGLVADPASCAPCTCDGSALCSVEITRVYSLQGCGGTSWTFTPLGLDVCTPFAAGDFDAARGYDSGPVGGSCAGVGGDATLPAPSWQQVGRVCSGAFLQGLLGGCDDGTDLCAPRPSAQLQRCFIRDGTWPCPAPYTLQTILYGDVDDQRDCTPCSCSTAFGVSCNSAQTLFYDTADCSGAPREIVDNDGNCTDFFDNAIDGSAVFTVTPTFGGCNPSGGAPTGTAVGAEPTTACCLPGR